MEVDFFLWYTMFACFGLVRWWEKCGRSVCFLKGEVILLVLLSVALLTTGCCYLQARVTSLHFVFTQKVCLGAGWKMYVRISL